MTGGAWTGAAVGLLVLAAFLTGGGATRPPAGEAATAPAVPTGDPAAPASETDPAAPPGAPGPTARVPVRPALDAAPAPSAGPVRVRVEALGIDMRVVPVGVAADGTMELPGSADEAGWYRYGPGPASGAGTVVLAAHVDSRTGIGPFAALSEAVPGATVVVEAGGATYAYAVQTVEEVSKTAVEPGRLFDRSGPPRIALVTCGGVFDRDTGHYRDNVIVVATPVVQVGSSRGPDPAPLP